MLLRILRGKKDTKYILKKKREKREEKSSIYMYMHVHVHVNNSAKKMGAVYTCIDLQWASLCG